MKVLEFYEENITALVDWFTKLKLITKIHITGGHCAHCKRRVFAIAPPKQKVSIGDNVKELVVFHITVLQLSHSQVIDFLKSHKSNYDTVFVLGKNRGKGNAIDLLGENYRGIGVTDDYGAYTNIFKPGNHALCWAHPHRKFRDLKNSKYLEKKKKIDRYFVCIVKVNVPSDNNKAERSLRHLVIKRKKSFGQKTPKGAEMMSIIYSVVMSLWWRSKNDFFRACGEALS